MKKISFYVLISLISLFVVATTTIQAVKAESCIWTLHAECRDLGSYWIQSGENKCTGDKPNGVTAKCCCAMGCCQFSDYGKNYSITTIDRTECEILVDGKGKNANLIAYTPNSSHDGKGGCQTISIPDSNTTNSIQPILDSPQSGSLSAPQSGSLSTPQSGSLLPGSQSGSLNTRKLESYPNPLNTIDIRVVIGKVVRAVLVIVGALALIMFVYGGFTWLTSAGNEQKVETGRNTLIWSALGLIIVFSAYVLVHYVMEAIGVV